MPSPAEETTQLLPLLNNDDRQIVSRIIEGNSLLAALFLKQKCAHIFIYIKDARLKDLDLNMDDLISDFYLYLQENNWEKLRSFRFESRLVTWISIVASRYLLKKYAKELKERSKTGTLIDSVPSLTDDDPHKNMVRAELLDSICHLEDKRYQQVLLLGLQGFDPKEIADRLGTSVNNVYVLKSRAIGNLKNLMDE